MKPFRISRRFLLRGAGSLGVALPLLEVMTPLRRAFGQAATVPKRFFALYEQSGFIYSQWKPTGSADSFTLSPTLMPLEPYKSKLLIIDGLTNGAATKGMGDDHQKGVGSALTGIETVGSTASPSGGGISLDQELAGKIGTTTKFKSLELGVMSGAGSVLNNISYSGASKPLSPVSDPAQIYSRIFANFTAPAKAGTTTAADPAAVRLVTERRSVLDAVKESYSSLMPRVSADDRVKLDAHLTSIREIEKSLAADPAAVTSTGSGAACVKPASMTIDARKNDNIPAIAKLHLDLLSMAFICDLTRVSTMQVSYEAGDPVYSWLGSSRGHHAISHDADSSASSQKELAAIDKWHAEQFAYFLGKLAAAPEGTGTVLDNTLAIWINGLAKGNIHSHGSNPPQPIVTAGSAGGAIKTGRYLTAARGTNTNDVYVSILQAFGGTATTFGGAAYCKGPMAGFAG